ncbi:MAG: hypothetical protein EMLJLAPB_00119 [Candidatus Argoarchaeum ethanivorans]|uniref:Gins51 C-terminal domain-containing protein n=1 Tax=Candidatus Argoarchaeum ethanivorans TaxID=2608793 RepID=A0A811T2I7_9EURY|nr:MAG: hypothetical protein EMLJLAPB_00119 [Candidatus Argoarchaeum ethanivorans]
MVNRRTIDDAVRMEKESSKLSALDDDFYQQSRAFLQSLYEELKNYEPDSSKYNIIQRGLKNTRDQIEKLFELRMWKLLKKSALKGEDDATFDTTTLTVEERKTYNELRKTITSHQQLIFNITEQKKPNIEPVTEDAAQEQNIKTETSDNSKRNITDEYIVVRVLQDIPQFRGIDMHDYTLTKDDVAVLPGINADALCKRDIAVKINLS